MSTEMILAVVAFAVFAVMWVVLPSRLHRGHESSEED
jgi:hypothetical protein